ncbi:uncharacterized protein LOC110910591 [Helianthus annuus]|uniref:uncharacterized protein LOC110910591 n=1 Tax=Helianthus annuus TaxID=4232 RepID=UPI000B908314|nr:uncharacterized protein LOC110910591 [Helianthus annuus]
MYGPNFTDNKWLEVFSSNIEDILKKYEVKKLELVDLIFIPVLQGDHFYCLCFHMRTEKVELIDNSGVEAEFDAKYEELPKTLWRILILFLKKTLKTKKKCFKQMETSIIERKTMEWRTVNNGVDCGVFTMLHMETYRRKTP